MSTSVVTAHAAATNARGVAAGAVPRFGIQGGGRCLLSSSCYQQTNCDLMGVNSDLMVISIGFNCILMGSYGIYWDLDLDSYLVGHRKKTCKPR